MRNYIIIQTFFHEKVGRANQKTCFLIDFEKNHVKKLSFFAFCPFSDTFSLK